MDAFNLKAIYTLFGAKTSQTYVEMFALNTNISRMRVHCVEPDLYGIKIGCIFFYTL